MKTREEMKVFERKSLPDDLPVGTEVGVISKDGKYRKLLKVGEFKGKCKDKVNPRKSVWYGKEEEELDRKKHGHAIRDFRGVASVVVKKENLDWEREPDRPKGHFVYLPSEEVSDYLQPRLKGKKGWIKLTLGGLDVEDDYIYIIHVSYRRKRR